MFSTTSRFGELIDEVLCLVVDFRWEQLLEDSRTRKERLQHAQDQYKKVNARFARHFGQKLRFFQRNVIFAFLVVVVSWQMYV